MTPMLCRGTTRMHIPPGCKLGDKQKHAAVQLPELTSLVTLNILPMATLHARKGDVQALKAIAAAGLASAQVTFAAATLDDIRAKGNNPFGNNTIWLATGSVQLSEPNAAAAYLGERSDYSITSIILFTEEHDARIPARTDWQPCKQSSGLAHVECGLRSGLLQSAQAYRVRPTCSERPIVRVYWLQGGSRDTYPRLHPNAVGTYPTAAPATLNLPVPHRPLAALLCPAVARQGYHIPTHPH